MIRIFTDAGNPIDVTPEDWAEADLCLERLAQSVSPAWFLRHREDNRRRFAIAAAAKRMNTRPIADGPCGCVVMGEQERAAA